VTDLGQTGPDFGVFDDPSLVEANPFHDEPPAAPVLQLAPTPEPMFHALTARELTGLPEPPDDAQLLGHLILRGARTIVVGDTGHGKTTFVQRAIGAIVNGGELLGYTGAGDVRALVVDLEQGVRSIKRAIRDAGLDDSERVYYLTVPDGLALDSDPVQLAELERLIVEINPAVVSLDPFYKAHRADDPNAERPVVDLMRALDALRSRHGFALILPAHPRKDIPGRDGARKLTLHDIAGSGAVVRGAEVVIAIERLSHGYARLRFLKDRDGDLPVGDAWPLLFDREQGFRRDTTGTVERDIAGEIEEFLLEHPWSTTNAIREGIAAGKDRVIETLKASARFTYERGPNNAHLWVVCGSQNHSDHPSLAVGDGSGLGDVSGPLRGPSTETTRAPGGSGHLGDHQADPEELEWS
jgi:hypothetical protein